MKFISVLHLVQPGRICPGVLTNSKLLLKTAETEDVIFWSVMFDTLIAGGGQTLSLTFVVHIEDVWRWVNREFFWFGRYVDSLLIHGMDSESSTTHPILRCCVVVPSHEGVSYPKSFLSQITVVGICIIKPSGTIRSLHNCKFARAVSCSGTAKGDTICPSPFK